MRQTETFPAGKCEKIVPLDSSKTEKKSTFHICRLEETDMVISDEGISGDFRSECEKAGVELR